MAKSMSRAEFKKYCEMHSQMKTIEKIDPMIQEKIERKLSAPQRYAEYQLDKYHKKMEDPEYAKRRAQLARENYAKRKAKRENELLMAKEEMNKKEVKPEVVQVQKTEEAKPEVIIEVKTEAKPKSFNFNEYY